MAFKFDHYSEEVFNAIRRFLDKKHLHYTASEVMGLIQLDLPTGGMIRRVDLRINVNEDSYTVRALSSVSADPKDAKSMARLAEYLTRVNYRLRNGNFEMDYRDGELAFKCYVDCHGGVPVQEAIDDSVFCPPAMFHQFGNGILQVLFSDIDPKLALEDCEARRKKEAEEDEEAYADEEDDETAEEDGEDAEDGSSALRVLQDIDPDLTASIGSAPHDPATLDRLLDQLLASFQPSEGDGTIIDVTDLDSEADDAAPADGEAEDDDQAEDAEEAYADEEDDEAYGDEEDDNED